MDLAFKQSVDRCLRIAVLQAEILHTIRTPDPHRGKTTESAKSENHTGDIHYFNKDAALQAISATNQMFNCGAGTDFYSIQCAIDAGAEIANYADNGLTSAGVFGAVCSVALGGSYPCAFTGINPNAPPMEIFRVC